MKLAISNIAWEQYDDLSVLELLRANGVSGIEIAPTKLWHDWIGATHKRAREYRKVMENQGFELPAMQAILFGKPRLQLFDATSHNAFLEHIKLVSDLAAGFDSKVIVFGAPKNRKRGQIPHDEAMDIALEFFYKVGDICIEYECCLGLEHNPIEYDCDFVTNVLDAKELVAKVNHKGFKLHVDSAGLHMCGGDIPEIIEKAGEFVHYHISEPMLKPIYNGVVDQEGAIKKLKDIDYKEWVSIEMKQPPFAGLLEKSLQFANKIVFDK